MEYSTYFKTGILAICTLIMLACGGNDSGSGTNYTGKTEQAVLTAENDDSFGTTMLEGSASSKAANPFPFDDLPDQPGGGVGKQQLGILDAMSRQFSSDIERRNTQAGPKALPGAIPTEGPCGGSLSFGGNDTSGSITYSDYCVGLDGYFEMIFNGSMSFSFLETNTGFEINISYTDFSVTIKTPEETTTHTGSGNMTIVFAGGSSFTVTYNNTFERDGQVFKIEELTFTDGMISGVFYHPDYGYVEVATDPDDPFIELDTGEFCGGTLEITGVDSEGATVVSRMEVADDCSKYTIYYNNSTEGQEVLWH